MIPSMVDARRPLPRRAPTTPLELFCCSRSALRPSKLWIGCAPTPMRPSWRPPCRVDGGRAPSYVQTPLQLLRGAPRAAVRRHWLRAMSVAHKNRPAGRGASIDCEFHAHGRHRTAVARPHRRRHAEGRTARRSGPAHAAATRSHSNPACVPPLLRGPPRRDLEVSETVWRSRPRLSRAAVFVCRV